MNRQALAAAALLSACKEQQSKQPAVPEAKPENSTTVAASVGAFRATEGVSEEALAELNSQSETILKQVLKRNGGIDAKVTFGQPGPLDITVELQKKKATRSVPPSVFGAELVSNLDHTLERAIRDAKSE